MRRVVGRYEILREIGRGGMAIVYAARQLDLDREVAIKELSSFHASSTEFAHRFLRESRLAGSLNHPNIVTVHEYFEHEGIPYIAMEYVSGGSLRRHVRGITLAQIVGVLEGVLAGLTEAESANIVHRDLKPENIMLTADGRVKITDFGIARATERAGASVMTATGMTVGTPNYMAPEQAMAADIGPWTDLYSVGVITYELFAGRVPFYDTETPMAVLMRHVNEPIRPAIEVVPDLDPELSSWIDSLLVKDPQRRVRHAATAWESLEEIVLRLLGPRWRREARLPTDDAHGEPSRPLTPAPFESQWIGTPTREGEVASAFVTFDPAGGAQAVEAPTPPAPVEAPTLTGAVEAPTPGQATVPEEEQEVTELEVVPPEPTVTAPEPLTAAPEPVAPTPPAPTAPAPTPPAALAPEPVAPAPPPPSPPPTRAPAVRRALLIGFPLVIAAAAAVVIVVAVGGGSSRTAISPQVPPCVRRFLAGTAANETLLLGLPNRYPRAGTDGVPVGLVLGTGRSVGAVRIVHHLQPSDYFEIQGAIDASTCQSAQVRDLLRPIESTNITPYDDLEVNLVPSPYYIRPGAQSPQLMEVDFTSTRPRTP